MKLGVQAGHLNIIINPGLKGVSPAVLNEEQMSTPVFVPTDIVTQLNSLKNASAEQFVAIKVKVHSLDGVKKITTKLKQSLNKQEGVWVDPSGQMKIIL